MRKNEIRTNEMGTYKMKINEMKKIIKETNEMKTNETKYGFFDDFFVAILVPK